MLTSVLCLYITHTVSFFFVHVAQRIGVAVISTLLFFFILYIRRPRSLRVLLMFACLTSGRLLDTWTVIYEINKYKKKSGAKQVFYIYSERAVLQMVHVGPGLSAGAVCKAPWRGHYWRDRPVLESAVCLWTLFCTRSPGVKVIACWLHVCV